MSAWADVEVEPEMQRMPSKPKQQQEQQPARQPRSYTDSSNSRNNGNGHGGHSNGNLRRQSNNNINSSMHRGHENNTSRGGRGGRGGRGRGGKNRGGSVINGGRTDNNNSNNNSRTNKHSRTPQNRQQRLESRERDTRSINSGGSAHKQSHRTVEMRGGNGRSVASDGGGGTAIFQAALGSAIKQPKPQTHGSHTKSKKSRSPARNDGRISSLGNPIRASPSPPAQRTSSFGNSSTLVSDPVSKTASTGSVPQMTSLGNVIPQPTSSLGNTTHAAAPSVAAAKTRAKEARQSKHNSTSESVAGSESKTKGASSAAANEAMKKLQIQLESMRVAKAKSDNRAKIVEKELETFAKKDIQKDAELKLLDRTNKSFRNIRNKLEKERDEQRIKAFQAEKRATALEAETKELKAKTSNIAKATGPAVVALQQHIAAMSVDVEAANAGWAKAHAHSETQALDIEMLEAQTKYDEARIENLDITVAEQALHLADAETAKLKLEEQIDELRHALEVSQKELKEVRAEALLLAGNINVDAGSQDEASEDEDEHAQDVKDGSHQDDDRDGGNGSNQDDVSDDDGGSNEDADSDDSDDGEEKPWLLAIDKETEEDVRAALEVDENELIVLDAAEWISFDAFVRSIVPLLTRAQREDPNAAQACIATATALEPFSRAFWQMCCDTLTKVCDLVTVVIVDMSKEESTFGSSRDVPKRDELLRLLVCVVYEAYSLAENADKFVVALRGVKPGNLGAEDPTGNATNPSFHHVATLEDLNDIDCEGEDGENEEQ